MARQFLIQGTVVDTEMERFTSEDVCPSMFSDFLTTLKDGEDIEVLVNSVGGSVTGGISIANMIRKAQSNGHNTTAIVQGLAASIASVIVCACDNIEMYESSFLMIHNCWSIVQGNSNDLRREADIMEKMNLAIMSFYKGKFNLEESEIKILMDNETWISGKEASAYCLKCDVIGDQGDFKIAAKLTNFKNVPRVLNMNKKTNEEKKVEETEEVETTETTEEVETTEPIEEEKEVVDEKKLAPTEEPVEEEEGDDDDDTTEGDGDDTTPDTTPDTPTPDAPATDEVEEDEEDEEKDECGDPEKKKTIDKMIQARVSGMQSKMQAKINALTKDFNNQLKAKDEELTKVTAEVISLKTALENATSELTEKSSALEEKEQALAKLNASVLKPNDCASQVDWHDLKGKDFFNYLKQNNIR